MRVVSPYRPFPPESQAHLLLGRFDWIEALDLLGRSVDRSCRCETVAITDVDTVLPVPYLQFQTQHRRLMLWLLEVCLRYLESSAFDRDTVMISPDTLVYRNLAPYFHADLGIIVRAGEKYTKRPILNGVQWWAVAAQDRLVAFYRAALALAETLPDEIIRWGADTVPLVQLLAPIQVGRWQRGDLSVQMFDRGTMMQSLSATALQHVQQRRGLPNPTIPILDFKYTRKRAMRVIFDATIGREAAVLA